MKDDCAEMTDYAGMAKYCLGEATAWLTEKANRRMADLYLRKADTYARLALSDQLKTINDSLDLLRQAVEVLHEMGEPIDDHPADTAYRVETAGATW